jgi:hypothetical protein
MGVNKGEERAIGPFFPLVPVLFFNIINFEY